VGSPAAPSASLTSALRLASGDATASLAAVWIVGFEQQQPDQHEGDQQDDQRDQCLHDPGRQHRLLEQRAVDRDRRPALGLHEQLERAGLGWPRQNRLTGLTRILANPPSRARRPRPVA
jgi:hypothetical protein